MATPNAMPKSANQIRQQLAAAFEAVKPETWNFKKLVDPSDPKSDVTKKQVTNHVLKFPLAQNISVRSVERAIRKWAA